MPDNNVNREYKDTLFRLIFGEHKSYALALYNAVNHTDYTDESEIKIKTLRDALYVDVKNDVGYVFHDVMNLIEHQATFNPNMPLRGLGYFADMYKEYISDVLRRERDKVENILIRGLTEEEKKKLERLNQEYYMEEGLAKGRQSTKLEDVDRLVASGVMDAVKACEVLGVSYDEYDKQ
ncbi:MAG: hypothetical protein IKG25_03310 [Mogibacterium sp.]|nr:hypothetical protein [Mogibacterium sp.]